VAKVFSGDCTHVVDRGCVMFGFCVEGKLRG
jgi:hypothetical protein